MVQLAVTLKNEYHTHITMFVDDTIREVLSYIGDKAIYRLVCKQWRRVIDKFDDNIDVIYKLARSPDTRDQALALAKNMPYHTDIINHTDNHIMQLRIAVHTLWIIDCVGDELISEFDKRVTSEKEQKYAIQCIINRDDDYAYTRLEHKFNIDIKKICEYVKRYNAVKIFLYLHHICVRCSLTWPLVSLDKFKYLHKHVDKATLAHCVRKSYSDDIKEWFNSL